MKITFNPSIKTFSGSFKQPNPNDLLPESDNWHREQSTYAQAVTVPKSITRKPMMKSMVTADDGIKTSTTLWEAQKDALDKYIPQNIKDICKYYRINPTQDLFMISGTNDNGELFVIFNSFFRHEKTFDVPKRTNPEQNEQIKRFVDCEQIYCMKSTNDKPTPIQKKVVKIFNDSFTKKYFLDASTTNPLKTICDPGVEATKIFVPAIEALASVANDKPFDEMTDENGKINRVVYTADGKYTRYKIIHVPILNGKLLPNAELIENIF